MRAYNPCMLHSLQQLFGNALIERFTLMVNHVISSEAAAVQRLRPHAGRCIRLHIIGWPSALPPLPALANELARVGAMLAAGVRDAVRSLADLAERLRSEQPVR